MTYTLTRTECGPNGTIGELCDEDGNRLCYTCERPDNGNQPDGCIPTGTYAVIPHNSSAHPNTWEITGVPNRSAILIHNGNTENDSAGCVLVGDSVGTLDGLPAVLNSVATLEQLRTELPSNFQLLIQ